MNGLCLRNSFAATMLHEEILSLAEKMAGMKKEAAGEDRPYLPCAMTRANFA